MGRRSESMCVPVMKSGREKLCGKSWKARRHSKRPTDSGCSKLPRVMICPACNTEFPHGTVFCSRCHVTLVADVAEADEMVEKAYPGSALVQLWRGEDAAQAAPKAKSPATGVATCEVWSGDDENLAGFLGAALKENGIPIRVERHGQKAVIYAPPEDEGRAREIIREIVEGAPPV